MLTNKKAVSWVAAIVLVVVVITASMVGYYVWYSTQPVVCQPGFVQSGSGCVPSTSGGMKAYSIGFTYSVVNTYATGTAITGTSAAYTLYSTGGKNLKDYSSFYNVAGLTSTAIASGATATSWSVSQSDSDHAFLVMYGGSDTYLDVGKIQSQPWVVCNDGSSSCANSQKGVWIPVASSTIGQYVVEINTRYWQEPSQSSSPNAGDHQITVYAVPEDSSITLTGPGTTTSGAKNTNLALQWKLTAITANDGYKISQIYLTSNQTTSTIQVTSVTIGDNLPIYWGPGAPAVPNVLSNVLSTSMSGGATQTWYFWGNVNFNQPGNAILITNPTSSLGDTTFTVAITTGGWSSNPNLYLYIAGVGPDGAAIAASSAATVLTA